jgi:hypothetical protein
MADQSFLIITHWQFNMQAFCLRLDGIFMCQNALGQGLQIPLALLRLVILGNAWGGRTQDQHRPCQPGQRFSHFHPMIIRQDVVLVVRILVTLVQDNQPDIG